jgi:hypothetical protein
MLALAYEVERTGSNADAARALGLTRARLTQITKLLLLSPVIQERLLTGELVATERALRAVVQESIWQEQLDVLGRTINHSNHE